MENPWTLATERVLISKPEYEWERQWVNPDGGRTAYPIYVNESPQYFHSKDNRTVIVYYAASGCWSPYYCTGMLTADADSDLLNPASWKKSPVPVFQQRPEDGVYTWLTFPFFLRLMERNGIYCIRQEVFLAVIRESRRVAIHDCRR